MGEANKIVPTLAEKFLPIRAIGQVGTTKNKYMRRIFLKVQLSSGV